MGIKSAILGNGMLEGLSSRTRIGNGFWLLLLCAESCQRPPDRPIFLPNPCFPSSSCSSGFIVLTNTTAQGLTYHVQQSGWRMRKFVDRICGRCVPTYSCMRWCRDLRYTNHKTASFTLCASVKLTLTLARHPLPAARPCGFNHNAFVFMGNHLSSNRLCIAT